MLYRREGANVVIADLNQAATDAAAADLGGTDRCNRRRDGRDERGRGRGRYGKDGLVLRAVSTCS